MTMTNVYSEEARLAARELRKRIKDDLDAGRFTSSSGARRPTKVVAEGKRAGKTSHGRSKSAPTS
jgi:hypothetical protein